MDRDDILEKDLTLADLYLRMLNIQFRIEMNVAEFLDYKTPLPVFEEKKSRKSSKSPNHSKAHSRKSSKSPSSSPKPPTFLSPPKSPLKSPKSSEVLEEKCITELSEEINSFPNPIKPRDTILQPKLEQIQEEEDHNKVQQHKNHNNNKENQDNKDNNRNKDNKVNNENKDNIEDNKENNDVKDECKDKEEQSRSQNEHCSENDFEDDSDAEQCESDESGESEGERERIRKFNEVDWRVFQNRHCFLFREQFLITKANVQGTVVYMKPQQKGRIQIGRNN